MNKNTEKFLKILQIRSSELFDDIVLYKVRFNKENNSGVFWFHLSKNFAKIYEIFKNKIIEKNLNFVIHFSFMDSNKKLNEKIQIILLDGILYNNRIKYELFSIDNISVDLEKHIVNITVEDINVYYLICNKYQLLYLLLNVFSYNFKIEINHVDDTETLVTKEIQLIEKEKYLQKSDYFKYSNSENEYKQITINNLFKNSLSEKNKIKIHGKIFKSTFKEIKSKAGKNLYIINYYITDYINSVLCDFFAVSKQQYQYFSKYNDGDWVEILGSKKYNNYIKDYIVRIEKIRLLDLQYVSSEFMLHDENHPKRIELNVHTKYSAMDGCSSIIEYLKVAALDFKWSSIALTDINNVQCYPDAYNELKKINKINPDFKLIYGCELNCIDVENLLVINCSDDDFSKKSIVAFDLETTGLYTNLNEIIEIAAVKKTPSGKIEKFETLVKCKKPIPKTITDLTSITTDMVNEKGIPLKDALLKFKDFIGDSIVIAHNLQFDHRFIKQAFLNEQLPELKNSFIDSLWLSRFLEPNYKSHSLKKLASKYKITYESEAAHRALYDSQILLQLFTKLILKLNNNYDSVNTIKKLFNLFSKKLDKKDYDLLKYFFPYKILIYCKNQKSIKSLYEIISYAHTQFFYKKPTVTKDFINKYRKDFFIASPFNVGEIFDSLLNESENIIKNKMMFYDALQLNPLFQYKYLVADHKIEDINLIKEIIIKAVNLAEGERKICYASSEPFYVYKNQKIIRDIIINSKAIGGINHYLYNWNNIKRPNPEHHLLNTKEMLHAFNFFPTDVAKKLVIYNPKFIESLIDTDIKPIKQDLYKPIIKDSDIYLKKYIYQKAHKKYGDKFPDFIQTRMNKEMDSIIKNGYDIVYWISHLLVKKSFNDGFIVGSRGSVGSSFIAYLSDITEVNPLPPHYYCKKCCYVMEMSNFIDSGYDLPTKKCPNCMAILSSDGQDIPFETFIGFSGNKIPDIDLNFARSYQAIAHEECKNIFGAKHIFRAGTVNTIQTRTAYGLVKTYIEERFLVKNAAEIDRLCTMIQGIKRTTGQHPGGIIVVPKKNTIFDFSPYNYPADDINSLWYTTHFDFNAIHNNLLKLDLLGHLDPEILRYLHKITNINPLNISFNDSNVMSLYQNNSFLKDKESEALSPVGTLGLPEFGTVFVCSILTKAKPNSFADLIRVCGLAHGTNVWLNNAEDLIVSNKLGLNDLITCRDDILNHLVSKNIDPKIAFDIMESVRKGNGISSEYTNLLLNNNIDKWYVDCCNSIKYMFPKAHAAAYVINSWRVAWYKYYKPIEFYSAYLTYRSENFEYPLILESEEILKSNINNLEVSKNNLKVKDQDLLNTLKIIYELKLRGIKLLDIDLYKSDSENFICIKKDNTIILPFRVIPGLGKETADSIVKCRNESPFKSLNDLKKRTKINKNHIKIFSRFF